MNPSTSMAGPCAGIILWALVSGDTLALDSGLEVAGNLHWRTTHSSYSSGANEENDPAIGRLARETGLQATADDESAGYEPVFAGRTAGNFVQAMLLAFMATGDREYLDVVARHTAFLERYETSVGPSDPIERLHFETTYVRALGHYVLLRRDLGLEEDAMAVRILTRRMDLLTRAWDPRTRRFTMAYEGAPTEVADNWLLAAADAYAAGALVLGRADLLDDFGRAVFEFGSRNQFYAGSAISYHSTKEFVNQVGFGNVFLYAWEVRHGSSNPPPPEEPPPPADPGTAPPTRSDAIVAVADTTLFADAESNTGAKEALFALQTEASSSRILVRFPAVDPPAGARVSAVYLEIYFLGGENPAADRRLSVAAIGREWLEGEGLHEWDTEPSTPGATWRGPRPGETWEAGDLGGVLAEAHVPAEGGCWLRLPLPPSALSNGHGFAIEAASGRYWRADFASSEHPDRALRPRLIVEYESR